MWFHFSWLIGTKHSHYLKTKSQLSSVSSGDCNFTSFSCWSLPAKMTHNLSISSLNFVTCKPFQTYPKQKLSSSFTPLLQARKLLSKHRVHTREYLHPIHVHQHPSCIQLIPHMLPEPILQGILLNGTLISALSLSKYKILTPAGLRHAAFLGVLLWTTVRWQGYLLCITLLIIGSLLTRVGRKQKEQLGIAEGRGGARGPENLWGAAGVAAICALTIGLLGSSYDHLREGLFVAYSAAIATKLADTSSSEIGKAFGTRTYLITTLKPVPRGTEGAVSLEGTTAGFLVACATAVLALAIGLISKSPDVPVVIIAAMLATTAESVIGAALQKKLKWSNEFVNFINTAIGALSALVLHGLLMNMGYV